MVLDGQEDAVPGDDGCGQPEGMDRRIGESLESVERGEGLVTPAREHHRADNLGTGLLRRSDLSLEPIQSGVIARQSDDPFQVHRGGLGPFAESTGAGRVASPQADLNATSAERSGMVEESDRVGESVLGTAVAIAAGPDRERVDDQAERLTVIRSSRGRIGQGWEGTGGGTRGEHRASSQSHGSPRLDEGFELAVPGRPVWPYEHGFGFAVVDDRLTFSVPSELPAETE